MPSLKKIVISDFRNISFQELSFSPNINCISGPNGSGKTNLVDAIYYMSMTKSAFGASDRYNFRHGTSEFSMCGSYMMENGLESKISVKAGSSSKILKRDDKPYGRLSEHIGLIPIVTVSPSDVSLVSEGGEERRRFVNSVLSQMDRSYLSDIQQYERLLSNRNKLLKESPGLIDGDLMSVIDLKMSCLASPVHKARKSFAERLTPLVAKYYNLLSSDREKVSISYESDLDRASLEDLLRASAEKDTTLGYTSRGIHRDDFIFTMDGYPIRRCGSQGQQKSFLVALKFAQYEIMKESYGFAPILLLDDVFDKLDMSRISNLIEMVASEDFGQIFVTDSSKVRMAGLVDKFTSDRAYFEADGGIFTEIK